MVIVMSWRRLPPPGFIGGAELTEGLSAALLATKGIKVHFVGASENPRDPQEMWRPWLESLLALQGIVPRRTGTRLDYEWRGVRCSCVEQSEVLDATRELLRNGADLLWTSQEGCEGIAALATETPVASYAHSVTSVGLMSASIRPKFLLAPSRFVQQTIRSKFGIHSHLVRTVLEDIPVRKCSLAGRSTVLFINPIPEKGLVLALTLARSMPHIQFVFVEAWRPIGDLSQSFPDNVVLLPRQPDLRPQYTRARLVIVPSIVPDASPRVISEAGLHGMPVLGSTRGGIPEFIANPLVNCIATSNVDGWRNKIEELFSSDTLWIHAATVQQGLTSQLFRDPYSWFVMAGLVPPST